MIEFFVETLVAVFRKYGNPDDFLGHVGGDDFVAETTLDRAEKLFRILIKELDSGIKGFYSKDDLEKSGHFQAAFL